jgi:hypothetical protein
LNRKDFKHLNRNNMKKVLLMLSLVAATSMVALAHGDDKCKDSKKTTGCCSKDAKKEASTTSAKASCCSKDGAKTAALSKDAKVEKSTAAEKETAPKK